ncbi:hypothetical protein ACFPES_28190 [Paenibacillus sp. GCM10023248]|nr:hypothetical protein [Paenibacillus sp. MAHUQ-63]MDD9270934.1 hypothetical protein [Paenibacillus sp. MAHUQ-63]MDR6882931.1 hypothetical protein [Bacillus sp. 3255]
MIRLKRKVITVSLSLSTFLVMGTAYAYSDAGIPLQNWYKASFQQGKNEVNTNALLGLNEADHSLRTAANATVFTAKASLKQVQVDTIGQSTERIDAVNRQYASQIDAVASEIAETEAPDRFNQYVSTANGEIESEIDQYAVDVLRELSEKLGK